MTEPYRHAFFGIHGWWGAGKTWLAHTLPGPRLALDTEHGTIDIRDRTDRPVGRVISWDPLTAPVPTDLGPDDTCYVNIRNLAKLNAVLLLLESGNHPFNSAVLDSGTEMQAMVKTQVANPGKEYDPNAVFDQQAWGRLKNHGGLTFRRLRDLTVEGETPKPISVAIVLGSDNEAIPAAPLLEGGLRKQVAGWFDLFGYLFTHTHPETKEELRVLQIVTTPTAVAKCRLHSVKVKYGPFIENPDLSEILNTLNGGTK